MIEILTVIGVLIQYFSLSDILEGVLSGSIFHQVFPQWVIIPGKKAHYHGSTENKIMSGLPPVLTPTISHSLPLTPPWPGTNNPKLLDTGINIGFRKTEGNNTNIFDNSIYFYPSKYNFQQEALGNEMIRKVLVGSFNCVEESDWRREHKSAWLQLRDWGLTNLQSVSPSNCGVTRITNP